MTTSTVPVTMEGVAPLMESGAGANLDSHRCPHLPSIPILPSLLISPSINRISYPQNLPAAMLVTVSPVPSSRRALMLPIPASPSFPLEALLQVQKPSLGSGFWETGHVYHPPRCSASQTNQWQSGRLRGLAQSHPSLSFTRACQAANGKGDDVKQPICRFLTLFTNCRSE